MPPALALFSRNPSAAPSKGWDRAAVAALAALHLAAFAVLAWTEQDLVPRLIFFFTWGLANCVWLVVLRRPAVSAGLSLILVVVLILLSQFKQDVLLMSANFVDLMLI